MTRGQRSGSVTKAELHGRLARLAPPGVLPPSEAPLAVLLGHAIFYRLVSDDEVRETVPRTERTIPCYLQPLLDKLPRGLPELLERYVLATSRLFLRGTCIANFIAQRLCGSRAAPGPAGAARYTEEAAVTCQMIPLVRALVVDDIRSSTFKHAFLSDRWPSRDTFRDANVTHTLRVFGHLLPSLPDWRSVMLVNGWDNAVNRMGTKFHGNVQVHVCCGLAQRVERYLSVVRLEEGTDRATLQALTLKRLQPFESVAERVTAGDYAMALRLRNALGASDDWYPPENAPWGAESFALHLFLVRNGPEERSYLPVADRKRSYCYLDAKVLKAMFGHLKKQQRAQRPKVPHKRQKKAEAPVLEEPDARDESDDSDEAEKSESLGELLGLTPALFNALNKAKRARVRRRLRQLARKSPRKRPSRRYRRRLRRRAEALQCGRMHQAARVDSVETDGVGLRLCVKEPLPMAKYIRALPSAQEVEAAAAAANAVRSKHGKGGKSGGQHCGTACRCCGGRQESAADDPAVAGPAPVSLGADTGRKKLFVAAVSRCGYKKPSTVVFTRARYYKEMGYHRHRQWSLERCRQPAVAAALAALASCGGLKNCDTARWKAVLAEQRRHDLVLDREFLVNKEHALWRMRLFRKKRKSLDSAALRLIAGAVNGEPMERKLVVGIGNAKMSATGRGEMAAPTTALHLALRRAIQRVRETGREVVYLDVWEFRTTKCCCACGGVTVAPRVVVRDRGGRNVMQETGGPRTKASGRLRLCTECETTGKLRDRDVQAARNILWLTQHMYYGAPRPRYMCKEPQG